MHLKNGQEAGVVYINTGMVGCPAKDMCISEWRDVGQITAAAMAARFGAPAVVWMGTVPAMVTKGANRRTG